MIFILLFLSSIILLLKYNSDSHYLLSPAIIVSGVFFMSIFVSALNYSRWGDISLLTVIAVLSGILAFCVGQSAGNRVIVFGGHKTDIESCKEEVFENIPLIKTVLVIAFMLVITAFDLNDIRNLAGGNISGIFQIVASARKNLYIESEAVSHGFLIQQGIYLCRVLAYIYIYAFFYKIIIRKERASVLYIVPIVIYAIQALLSTGRTEFIYLFYAILVINYLLNQADKQWIIRQDLHFSRKIIIALSAFIILFLFLANTRNNNLNIGETLSRYMGSSVKALDVYINENGIWSVSSFWGEYTQVLVYSLLRACGLSSNTAVAVMPHIYIDGAVTNIYTALGRYIHDYGFIGMNIIMMFLGFGYSYGFNSLKRKNSTGLSVIVYAFLSYPLVEMAIEERFFSNLITARTIYCLIYMFILFKWLLKTEYIEEI